MSVQVIILLGAPASGKTYWRWSNTTFPRKSCEFIADFTTMTGFLHQLNRSLKTPQQTIIIEGFYNTELLDEVYNYLLEHITTNIIFKCFERVLPQIIESFDKKTGMYIYNTNHNPDQTKHTTFTTIDEAKTRLNATGAFKPCGDDLLIQRVPLPAAIKLKELTTFITDKYKQYEEAHYSCDEDEPHDVRVSNSHNYNIYKKLYTLINK